MCVLGFGFSAYLTYREIATIHHICDWCLSSAVIITILTVLAIWRFLLGEPLRGEGAAAAGDGRPDAGSSLGALRS